MGYSEKCCQICAVSFNVARLRMKHEPQSDGWGYSTGLYYSGDTGNSFCTVFPGQSGCSNGSNDETDDGGQEIHFPGSGCTYTGGYNGRKISAKEMRGMNLPRYICAKARDSKPEDEETDYEKRSRFFVTTKTIEPPDDFDSGRLEVVRFGVDYFFSQNYRVINEDADWGGFGIPVHDSCWKIFEKVSKCSGDRLGIDLNGFVALWHNQACGMCGFQNLKQDPVIQRCREQFWYHLPGTEYLVANPYDIEGFLLALQDEVHSDRPKGEFIFRKQFKSEKSSAVNATDVFNKLPAELKDIILNYLPSKDIGSLRLVSRAFRQLRKALFYRLIKEELPWFWEFDELAKNNNDYREWLQTANPLAHKYDAVTEKSDLIRYVNWHEIYKQLLVLKKSVLGIRNRARVWALCEEIASRIQHLREEFGEARSHSEFEDQILSKEKSLKKTRNSLYCPRCTYKGL